MIGHKTDGGWDDVTSLGRNEIVFEGRHKAYGAYYIRKRYNFALLLGLLTSLSAVVVTAGVPLLIHLFAKKVVVANIPTTPREEKPTIITIDFPIKNKVQPPRPKPPVNQPKQATTKDNQVEVTTDVHKVDTTKTVRQMQDLNPGTTTSSGDHGHATDFHPTDPGTGTDAKTVEKPDLVSVAQFMPVFPGNLNDFIKDHVTYPAELREMRIEGTVYVSFVVETDGSVSTVKILRGVAGGAQLSDETIKVIKEMPVWKPGSQNGHLVRVQFTLPVHYQIE